MESSHIYIPLFFKKLITKYVNNSSNIALFSLTIEIIRIPKYASIIIFKIKAKLLRHIALRWMPKI